MYDSSVSLTSERGGIFLVDAFSVEACERHSDLRWDSSYRTGAENTSPLRGVGGPSTTSRLFNVGLVDYTPRPHELVLPMITNTQGRCGLEQKHIYTVFFTP